MKQPPICGQKEHQEYQSAKRKMYDGNLDALNRYAELYHRRLLFSNNSELAQFSKGQIIVPYGEQYRNVSLHHILRDVYKNYIRSLFHETMDSDLLKRMDKTGMDALRVFETKEAYPEMAECGINNPIPHAVWLIRTQPHTGYLLIHELHGKDNKEYVSNEIITKVQEQGRTDVDDVFEYEPQSRVFLKQPPNTWGGREIGGNLQFRGLLSYEHPISIREWFETVVRNLYREAKK